MAKVVQHNEALPLDNGTYETQHAAEADAYGFFSSLIAGQSNVSIAVTVLLILAAYDQSMSPTSSASPRG